MLYLETRATTEVALVGTKIFGRRGLPTRATIEV